MNDSNPRDRPKRIDFPPRHNSIYSEINHPAERLMDISTQSSLKDIPNRKPLLKTRPKPTLPAVIVQDGDLIKNWHQIPKTLKEDRHKFIKKKHSDDRLIMGPAGYPGFFPTFTYHYNVENEFTLKDLYARVIFPYMCTKPAVVPICSYNNDCESIRVRVTEVKEKQEKYLPPKWRRLLLDSEKIFTKFLHHAINPVLEPFDDEKVLNLMPKQIRAQSMRKQLFKLQNSCDVGIIENFQKRETYPTPSAPRTISACDDTAILRASRFTFAIAQAFHDADIDSMKWYMPGRSPKIISQIIANLTAKGRDKIFGADFSKFDASQTRFLRQLVARIASSLFNNPHDQHHCRETLEDEMNADATTTFGVRYEMDGGMPSGSAWTTISNTLMNGFLYFTACYMVARPMKNNKELLALFSKCAVYGDDSIGPLHIKDKFLQLCKAVGLTVTTEDFTEGAIFLGRIYFQDGSPDSIVDPRKVIPKLNITCAPLSVPTTIAAANRLHGYAASTIDEPWIHTICKAALRAYGDPAAIEELFTNDEKRHKENNGYRISPAGMEQAFHLAAKLLELDTQELQLIISQYSIARTFDEFPTCWYQNGSIINEKLKFEDQFRVIYMNDAEDYQFRTYPIADLDNQKRFAFAEE